MHANRNRFTVQQSGIIRQRLHGVANRVAEIQNCPLPAFALIGSDHRSFDFTTPADRLGQRGRLPPQHAPIICFHPLEKVRVVNRTGLDRLGKPGAQFAIRQRCQRSGIRHHQPWLMKHAHQIFALGQVDTGLAANRTVHLGQQRGWYLHERKSTQVGPGHKAGQITRHTATQSDDK